jgi:hypothetical protein
MSGRAPAGHAGHGPHRARCPPGHADRGAVTVEAALALCTLVVFLTLALGALMAVAESVRCIDAARELARLAARGEPERGREVAAQLAPSGARLELVPTGDTVVTTVSAELLHPLPIRISGRAVAAMEPGTVTS